MVSERILQRRKEMDPGFFAIGTVLLAFIAVPWVAFDLRSWRVIGYYAITLVLFNVVTTSVFVSADSSTRVLASLLVSVPFNVIYAYISVGQLRDEADQILKTRGGSPLVERTSEPHPATETKILRALANQGVLTLGRLCLATECSASDIEGQLLALEEQGIIKRHSSHDFPTTYELI